MAQKFTNPPVVEVGISFGFDPNENKRGWELERVQEYVRLYSSEMAKLEVLHEQALQVEETSPNELPKVISRELKLKAARISDEIKSRVLEIRDDQISFHHLRTETEYPSFETVLPAATEKLMDYLRLFQPDRIRRATLRYVDIIEIPSTPGSKLSLSDYFRISADVPEKPFGLIGDLSARFVIACPVDVGPLILQLKSLPAADEKFRFRLDWYKVSENVDSSDPQQAVKRLRATHDYIWECFQTCCTPRTLELFK